MSGIGDDAFRKILENNIIANNWLIMIKAMAKREIKIKGARYCIHAKKAKCDCRKPKPGMVHEVMERFNVRGDGLRGRGRDAPALHRERDLVAVHGVVEAQLGRVARREDRRGSGPQRAGRVRRTGRRRGQRTGAGQDLGRRHHHPPQTRCPTL